MSCAKRPFATLRRWPHSTLRRSVTQDRARLRGGRFLRAAVAIFKVAIAAIRRPVVKDLYMVVRIIKVTPRFTGFLSINQYEIEADRHAGGTQKVTRLVMERGHAVGVLAYDPARDEVVLVNELRPGQVADGVRAFSDALVAGVIDAGEDPLATAVREMKEEAGLELRDARVIHPGAYVSPGGTSEKIVLVFGHVDASAASGVHGHPDEQEDLLTVVLPAEEFIARTKRGDIDDMKTALAAWWLADYRRTATTATA